MKQKFLTRLTTLFFVGLLQLSYGQSTIQMRKEGGVYTVPCEVNGLKLRFIFDTGASDVSISLTEALFMLKNGYLNSADILGKEYYTDATGSISAGTKIILRKIEFGGMSLYNVEASVVHALSAPLLLGQSAMAKLGQFQIDPNSGSLVIINGTNNSYNYSTECDLYAEQADVYMRQMRYSDAQVSYSKKMTCSGSQSAADYFLLGKSYYFNKQYNISDSLFRIVISLKPASSVGYYWAARSTLYKKKNNIDEAIPLYDKYLEIASVDLTKASQKELAEAYLNKGKHAILYNDKAKAIEYLNKVLVFDSENKEAKDLLASLAKD